MTIDPSGALLIAVAIYAHAWTARIVKPSEGSNVVGWVISILVGLGLALVWLR